MKYFAANVLKPDDITTIITRARKRVAAVNKKYEKITKHTARCGFATSLYLVKVPTLAIMRMTGHKSENSFLKYIRVMTDGNAINIAQHPYFPASHFTFESLYSFWNLIALITSLNLTLIFYQKGNF